MTGVVLIVLVMAFAAMFLAFQGVYFYIRGRREDEQIRVETRLGITKDEEEEALASLLREQATDSMLERLGEWGRKTQEAIQQAGLTMTVSDLVTRMAAFGLIAAVAAFALVGAKGLPAGIAAAYYPLATVNRAATKRAAELLAQMPDALEMMSRAMQTGAGLVDCFRLVSVELKDPVAGEFGRIADEVKYGKDWRHALDGLVTRNPSLFDLRLLVSSLLLQRETGGNMIETLARISKLIRQRAAFDAKVKAMTSEARASGLVLALMPIGVMLLVLMANPAYLEPLISTGSGQMAVVAAIVMYSLGLFLMNQMQKVKV